MPTVSGHRGAAEAVVGDAKTLSTHLATYTKRRDGHASPQDVERYLYVLPAFREPALVDQVLATWRGTGAPQAVGPILRAMLRSRINARLDLRSRAIGLRSRRSLARHGLPTSSKLGGTSCGLGQGCREVL